MSNTKNRKLFTLTALAVLLVAVMAPTFLIVTAQGTATVVVLESVGGTVSPSGINTYADGTPVTMTATPTDEGFIFGYWVISSEEGDVIETTNPLVLTVMGGATYAVQALFQPIQVAPGGIMPPNLDTAAIVIVLPSAGGTTTPAAGTYALADATSLMLSATASSGWEFSHWTICGESTDHGGAPVNWTPTDNPYNVNHGYGYTYYYQAVFNPIGSAQPTPVGATPTPGGGSVGGLSMEMVVIIGLVVVIVILLVAFALFAARRHK